MNTVELIRLMNRPRLLDDQTLGQINQLLEKYPFCQCLRMLYLKNLHKKNPEEFNTILGNNATLITDRAKLFQLIYEIDEQPLIPHEKSEVYSIESLVEGNDKDELLHKSFRQSPNTVNLPENDWEDQDELDESEDSLYNEMDFITETLAEIFVSKRKYEDAIKTYEKLCLKYPEKKVTLHPELKI